MLKHYNFIFDGIRMIEVTAASAAEARQKAMEIYKDVGNRNEKKNNETKRPLKST